MSVRTKALPRTLAWRVAAGFAAVMTVLPATGCWKRIVKQEPPPLPAPPTPASAVVAQHPSPIEPDFSVRGQSPAFQSAVGTLANESGLRFSPSRDISGTYVASASHASVEQNLFQWNQTALRLGFIVILNETSGGAGSQKDKLLALPTTDKYEVIQAAGTRGADAKRDNAAIIAWLRDMERKYPFTLTGAGTHFIEGHLLSPPENVAALAGKLYDFCPATVDRGTGSLDALAEELKQGTFYLSWD